MACVLGSRRTQPPLLAGGGRPGFEERRGRIHQRQLERGRATKTLPALAQETLTVFRAYDLSGEIPLSGDEPIAIGFPPASNTLSIGPRQIGVWIHRNVVVVNVVGGTRFESFGAIACHLLVVQIDAGDR